MGWTVGTDLAAHRAAVGAFLAADPVGHTSQATILATLAAGISWSDEAPVFALHRDGDGTVDGSAVRTPPHPLVLDGAHDVRGLAAALAGRNLSGVNAPEPLAEAFAAAWGAANGVDVRPARRLHLLALPDRAALVAPAAGTRVVVRPATTADLPVVVELVAAMREEIHEHGMSPAQILLDRIDAGLLFVLAENDEIVATAQASEAVAGVSRVAGVYTTPAARARGNAAVVTAAVTLAAYDAGAEHVCLFTDADNPTSNGVYERLGYVRRPDDRLVLRFEGR